MTLTQLEYFLAVHHNKSFSLASEKCFVTQPTLSMQIQKLEDELGVILFDRQKKPVLTTPIGEQLAIETIELLAQAKRMKMMVKEHLGEISGLLHIGIIPTIAPYLLPMFIINFLEKYPLVNLKIEELTTQQIINKLADDKLDLGILATPLQINSLTEVPLYQEEMFAYVSPKHPLYTQNEIDMTTIRPGEFLMMAEGHCFRNQVINICNQLKDQDARFSFESGSLETLIRMVDKHASLTIIPETAAMQLPKHQQESIKRIANKKPGREVSMVVKRTKFKNKLMSALQEVITASLPTSLVNNKLESVAIY